MKFLPRYILILRFFAVYTYTFPPFPSYIISIWSSTVPFHVPPLQQLGISISNEEILKTLAQHNSETGTTLTNERCWEREFSRKGNFWLGRKMGRGGKEKEKKGEEKMGKEEEGGRKKGRKIKVILISRRKSWFDQLNPGCWVPALDHITEGLEAAKLLA